MVRLVAVVKLLAMAAGWSSVPLVSAADAQGLEPRSAKHGEAADCVPTDTALCLSQERFLLTAEWKAQGTNGSGHARALTQDTGYFWFFDSANVEIVVKVLDGRPINGAFWVFYGGLSNVEYTLHVTDTATGEHRTYSNPAGSFASVGDTAAFPTAQGAGAELADGSEDRPRVALTAPHEEIDSDSQGGESESLSHVHCEGGFAHVYPCSKVDLLSVVPLSDMGKEEGGRANDIWGWSDPSTAVEYALVGLSSGMSIVELSDPERPTYVGKLPTHGPASNWRDIKVYGNYAYVVADNSPDHGLQVLNLTQLRQVTTPPVTFSATAHYDGFGSAHNLAINQDTGFGYAVGSDTCEGGLHMIDLRSPTQPRFVGCFSDDGYTHDAQCVLYHGPDERFRGREVCFASNVDAVTLVDVTEKGSPVLVSRTTYPGVGYTHQAWLTRNHAHLLVDDETDERSSGERTRTYIFAVSDLVSPTLIGTYTGSTTAIDHNQYTHRGFAFQANYRSGLRILELKNVNRGQLREVAFFDTFPEDDEPDFSGAWSVYPYFESGVVVVSGIGQGLFVLDPLVPGLSLPQTPTHFQAQIQGGGVELQWRDRADNEEGYRLLRGIGGARPELLAELAADATSFRDPGFHPSSTYRYEVRAFNHKGESDSAWVSVETPILLEDCVPGASVLCLGGGRFHVQVSWRDPSGGQGVGQAQGLTGDTGYFWYFDDTNVELVVKVLDGTSVNQHHWVFYGSLSNVEFTLTVTDTETGASKTYFNPAGQFASVGDTSAF